MTRQSLTCCYSDLRSIIPAVSQRDVVSNVNIVFRKISVFGQSEIRGDASGVRTYSTDRTQRGSLKRPFGSLPPTFGESRASLERARLNTRDTRGVGGLPTGATTEEATVDDIDVNEDGLCTFYGARRTKDSRVCVREVLALRSSRERCIYVRTYVP